MAWASPCWAWAALDLVVFRAEVFRALDAPSRDYRRTETWILLDKKVDLPADRVQSTIGTILQELYRRYA